MAEMWMTPELCTNSLHCHPLPDYMPAAIMTAQERLRHGWVLEQCPECDQRGWIWPRDIKEKTDG